MLSTMLSFQCYGLQRQFSFYSLRLAYFLYDVNNGITIQDEDDSSGQQQYTKELLSEYETKNCSQNQTT
jgi:hypothetical protein